MVAQLQVLLHGASLLSGAEASAALRLPGELGERCNEAEADTVLRRRGDDIGWKDDADADWEDDADADSEAVVWSLKSTMRMFLAL
mmetsp:Transcript_11804/g.22028  ORF Transcript_11804/g.22028 Transcript_11804/m.22028 type:complete len:86 (-) Transcript_11804:175-432(-)